MKCCNTDKATKYLFSNIADVNIMRTFKKCRKFNDTDNMDNNAICLQNTKSKYVTKTLF